MGLLVDYNINGLSLKQAFITLQNIVGDESSGWIGYFDVYVSYTAFVSKELSPFSSFSLYTAKGNNSPEYDLYQQVKTMSGLTIIKEI